MVAGLKTLVVITALDLLTASVSLPSGAANANQPYDPLPLIKVVGITSPSPELVEVQSKDAPLPISLTPKSDLFIGSRTDSVAGSPVGVYTAADFGVVTGKNAMGNEAAFVAIDNAAAPVEYRFEVTASVPITLNLQKDGSIAVTDAGGQTVNYIQRPWATDANGSSLPTSYSVRGQIITQHLTLSGATFPVIADPSFGCGPFQCQLLFNRTETHDWATAGLLGLGGAAGACGLAGPQAVAICAVAAAAIGVTAVLADNHKQCVALQLVGINSLLWTYYPYTYSGGYCR
jgi:hypothetical protein